MSRSPVGSFVPTDPASGHVKDQTFLLANGSGDLPAVQSQKYFPELAQASGDFANTIDDLDVLYDAGKLSQRSGDTDRVYRLMGANAREVFGNFSQKWEGQSTVRDKNEAILNR
jgi:hypothetical protein